MRRRDAEALSTQRALGLCGGVRGGVRGVALVRTLALVVALSYCEIFEAIMQLPSANVYDPPSLLRKRV